jgi:hypothetical protein
MSDLPPYITRELIAERLPIIFPEGLAKRPVLINKVSASTIFVMIYIGAIEGNDTFMGPYHVYRMTSEQASKTDDESREGYAKNVLNKGFMTEGQRWYADNSRESIRDEVLREGLVQIGVVTSLNLPTTSSKPRYAMEEEFVTLLNPDLNGDELNGAIIAWQNEHLSKSALTRLKLARHSSKGSKGKVLISLPTGEVRMVSPGPSSDISKSVIEVFAIKFLESPAVLWLSTSDDKVVQKDDELAKEIGLNIMVDRDLPDIILVDLAPRQPPLLVFIEVVATDGPVNERRQQALFYLTDATGFKRSQVTFVTAYLDRTSAGFKKTINSLAWNTFAWFVSEPEKIIVMRDGETYLSKLISFEEV